MRRKLKSKVVSASNAIEMQEFIDAWLESFNNSGGSFGYNPDPEIHSITQSETCTTSPISCEIAWNVTVVIWYWA